MLSLPLMLVLVAAGMAVMAKLVIPLFERHEKEVRLQQLAAVKAVHVLKDKVKPGLYTFRWDDGRLLEPAYEKREGNQVVFRFVAGDQVSDKVQHMPTDFQRQLRELIYAGMRGKKK